MLPFDEVVGLVPPPLAKEVVELSFDNVPSIGSPVHGMIVDSSSGLRPPLSLPDGYRVSRKATLVADCELPLHLFRSSLLAPEVTRWRKMPLGERGRLLAYYQSQVALLDVDRQDMVKYEARIRELEAERKDLEASYAKMRDRMEEMEGHISHVRTSSSAQADTISSLTEKVSTLISEKDAYTREIARLNKSLEAKELEKADLQVRNCSLEENVT